MKIKAELLRLFETHDSTIGIFSINGTPLCFTLEDEKQKFKVPGETRIPAGRYKLGLRKYGGFNTKYAARFSGIHKGMIEVLDVPGFTDILIHVGNTDEDTNGCILIGYSADVDKETISRSGETYSDIYPLIADQLEINNECELIVYDRFN